jgi:sodium pump decarboxylase gamma subunit
MLDKMLESLLLLIVGMGGVFVSLALLAGMIRCFSYADEALNKRRINRYAAQVEAHQVDESLNDEIVAVIVAAASATLRKSVIIRRVRLFDNRSTDPWAVTGRLNIMASHAISRRKPTL